MCQQVEFCVNTFGAHLSILVVHLNKRVQKVFLSIGRVGGCRSMDIIKMYEKN